MQPLKTTVPPGRQTLPAEQVGPMKTWTAILVDPTRELSRILQDGMLSFGAQKVMLARSANDIDEIIRCPLSAGDLAVVSVRLGHRVDSVIQKLRRAGWDRVLFFAPVVDIAATISAINAGATGVLRWPTLSSHFPQRKLARSLSKREKSVLGLVAQGLTNPQIGRELNLASSTVKRHLARIGAVIGSGNRSEMVAMALRAGLL